MLLALQPYKVWRSPTLVGSISRTWLLKCQQYWHITYSNFCSAFQRGTIHGVCTLVWLSLAKFNSYWLNISNMVAQMPTIMALYLFQLLLSFSTRYDTWGLHTWYAKSNSYWLLLAQYLEHGCLNANNNGTLLIPTFAQLSNEVRYMGSTHWSG